MSNNVSSLQELPSLNALELNPMEVLSDEATPTCTFCSVTCFNTAGDSGIGN